MAFTQLHLSFLKFRLFHLWPMGPPLRPSFFYLNLQIPLSLVPVLLGCCFTPHSALFESLHGPFLGRSSRKEPWQISFRSPWGSAFTCPLDLTMVTLRGTCYVCSRNSPTSSSSPTAGPLWYSLVQISWLCGALHQMLLYGDCSILCHLVL